MILPCGGRAEKERTLDHLERAQDVIEKALKMGGEDVDVYIEETREIELVVRNGEMEKVRRSHSKGLGLTIIKDKRPGFSYTSNLSPEYLAEIIKKTVGFSLIADPVPWLALAEDDGRKPADLDIWDPSIAQVEEKTKIDKLKTVEKIALSSDQRIRNSEGGVYKDRETEIVVANSNGVSRKSKSSYVSFGVNVIAEEAGQMKYGSWTSAKRHFRDLDGEENVAAKAVKRAVDKLGARPVATQKKPVLIDRYAASLFWQGILWALEGERALQRTTFLADSLYKQVTAKFITLMDDPTIPRHVASVPFDGEGRTTRKNLLIEQGKLGMFLYDTTAARRAGIEGNTIARRDGYKNMPSGGFLNAVVQNGNAKLSEMIKGIDEGIYVTELRGIGTDIPSGSFSVGATGFFIDKGAVAFPVDAMTLGGNTLEILKGIEQVADDLDMRGNINSPSFKVSEMTIGGK